MILIIIILSLLLSFFFIIIIIIIIIGAKATSTRGEDQMEAIAEVEQHRPGAHTCVLDSNGEVPQSRGTPAENIPRDVLGGGNPGMEISCSLSSLDQLSGEFLHQRLKGVACRPKSGRSAVLNIASRRWQCMKSLSLSLSLPCQETSMEASPLSLSLSLPLSPYLSLSLFQFEDLLPEHPASQARRGD